MDLVRGAYEYSSLQVLSKRVVTRLRALIILPTRDLVMQVRETLDSLSRGTGLKVGRNCKCSRKFPDVASLLDRYCHWTAFFRARAVHAGGGSGNFV